MPLKVFRDGSTSASAYNHIHHADAAPFKVGERVRVREYDDQPWAWGTVSELMPLKAFRDGSTSADAYNHIQHEDAAPFKVGERVRVRDFFDQPWTWGTVSELMPLKVFRDGSTSADAYNHIQHEDAAPFKVGERVRVRDHDWQPWAWGTVSELMPLKVF